MTLDRLYSLQDAYAAALEATHSGTIHQCRQWLLAHLPQVIEENERTLALIGLDAELREFRKKQSTPQEREESANFCLDLGMAEAVEAPMQFSLPKDPDNITSSECEWKPRMDVTVDDLDLHILMLLTKQEEVGKQIVNARAIRAAAARIVPGRTDIPLRELIRIRKEADDDE
jgi:hypothetical protein